MKYKHDSFLCDDPLDRINVFDRGIETGNTSIMTFVPLELMMYI